MRHWALNIENNVQAPFLVWRRKKRKKRRKTIIFPANMWLYEIVCFREGLQERLEK